MNEYTIQEQSQANAQMQEWRICIEEFLMKELPDTIIPNKLLDIGVGSTTNVLRKKYPNVPFHILDKGPYPEVEHNIDLLHASKKIEGGLYDVVICSEVLEHVDRPWLAADQLAYLTRPGGLIYITAPSFLYWHPMMPICDDYWRFMPNCIPLLFKDKHKLVRKLRLGGSGFQPTGICYVIEVNE